MKGDPQLYQLFFGLLNGYVTCRSSQTLAGLARRIGINPAGLAETVAAYNQGAERGEDGLGKHADHLAPLRTPPYYGIPLDKTSILFPAPCLTLGGLRTDGLDAQVLRADGTAIDGLYATGKTAVGVSSNGYVSGLSVADGIFTGRAAARHATARAMPLRSVSVA